MVRCRNVLPGPLCGGEGPLHVGLSRGHPYLSHKNILHNHLPALAPLHNENLPLGAGIQRGKLKAPPSLSVSRSALCLSCKT